ncbi:unnamed protein product, partial [Urochloa humidicola]
SSSPHGSSGLVITGTRAPGLVTVGRSFLQAHRCPTPSPARLVANREGEALGGGGYGEGAPVSFAFVVACPSPPGLIAARCSFPRARCRPTPSPSGLVAGREGEALAAAVMAREHQTAATVDEPSVEVRETIMENLEKLQTAACEANSGDPRW